MASMRCMSCMMYAIYAHTVLLMVGTLRSLKSLNRPSIDEAVPLAAREILIPPRGSDLAHHYDYDVDSMWDGGGAEAPKLRCLK